MEHHSRKRSCFHILFFSKFRNAGEEVNVYEIQTLVTADKERFFLKTPVMQIIW